MNLQFTLASRYLAGRKLRTFLTTLAIVFGVLVIFGMNTILPALVQAFQANMFAAAGQVDATISHKTGEAFSPALLDKVAAVDGVRVAAGMLERTVNLPADYFDHNPATPDRISALSVKGIDPARAQAVHAYPLTSGRFLQASDSASAVIAQSLADSANLKLGGTLALPSANGLLDLTIVGILPERALPGNEDVWVTLPEAQTIFDMSGKINTIEADFDSVDADRRAAIESALTAAIGSDYQLQAIQAGAELLTNMRTGQAIFNVMGVLALLMGGFIIFNTFRTIVAERRHDIGMLRAVGASRGTITGLILMEGLIQGAIGTALGLVLGYGLGLLVLNMVGGITQQFLNMRLGAPIVSPALLVISIAIGVGVTVAAGFFPALAASRMTPLEALRPSLAEASFKRTAGFGLWSGALMIAIALAALLTKNVAFIGLGGVLFMLGLILAAPALIRPIASVFARLFSLLFARGGTGQLAEGNLSRQPSRAAVTASTTMIALAIVVMASGLVASISIGFLDVLKKSLGSDYLLVPPSIAVWGTNVGAKPQLADDLRAIDGVDTVSTLRFGVAQVQGLADTMTISVLGIVPEDYVKVSGLTFADGSDDTFSLNGGRNIILNGLAASNMGHKVGDDVQLLTPTGKRTYHVVGIATDYLNAKIPTVYISQANIAADFARTEDVFLQVNLKPKADRKVAHAAILKAMASYPQFKLIAGQDYFNENKRIFDVAFSGMYALLIFLAIPSLIAMINTLAIGVIERTREIGMLRAIGATRSQIRTTIVAEALILAGIGTVFGLLSGLYLATLAVEAMSAAGYPVVFSFPADGVLVTVAAGLLFGVLAAIIPARQAARMNVIEALRYE